MQHRALLGWMLVGAFCASASCGGGGGNSGVPQGYGLACGSDKDCAQYTLMCGDDETCVQCLADSDCKPNQDCTAGLCKTPVHCESSKDCGNDQVCNETAGVCVECNTKRDCSGGLLCTNHRCADHQACEFTSDCDDGLLCDVDAGICVSCRTDKDCPTRRVCEAGECVTEQPMNTGGTEGMGGSGTAGSNNTAGTNTAGTNSGGTNTGGSKNNGGMSGMSGSAGSSGSGNEGGAPPVDCDCLGVQVCVPDDMRCVDPTVIDDFGSCDEDLLAIEGRSGVWYEAADTDVNITIGFGNPGSLWSDHSCAAWVTGGQIEDAVNFEYALLGAILDDGAPYSLAGYTGLQLTLESDNPVDVVLKVQSGYYFRFTLGYIDGSNVRTVPFNQMKDTTYPGVSVLNYLSEVTEIQFTAPDTTTFGFAVHDLQLY